MTARQRTIGQAVRTTDGTRRRARAGMVAGVAALAALTAGCGATGMGETGTGETGSRMVAATGSGNPGTVLEAFGGEVTSAYGNYLAALHASRTRSLQDAAAFMARALERDPDNPELLRRAFLLKAAVGDIEAAKRLAERVRQRDAGNGVAILFSAVDAAADGDRALAREHIKAMPDHGVSSLVKPLLLGWLDTAAGKLDRGLKRLDELEGVKGLGVLRHIHTALMNDVADNTKAAAKAYDAASGAASRLTTRLAWLTGNFYARQGKPAEARSIYRKLLSQNADDSVTQVLLRRLDAGSAPKPAVASVTQGMAEALFNVAGLLSQERASELALVYTQLALQLRPGYDAGRVLLGEVLQGQGNTKLALDAYARVPAESPMHLVAQVRRAELLATLGRTDKATSMLRDLSKAYPESYIPLYRLGSVLREQKKFDAAADVYKDALKRVKGKPHRRHWTLHYFYGIALERTDQWSQAEKHFRTALDLYPKQPYVMNYLAYSWVEQKKHLSRALTMLKKAVEQRPEDGFIVDSLGWAHYRLGNYDKAVQYLERAVELRPNDPTINDHLGDAYWRVDRRREARYQWQRALELGPRDGEAKAIRTKLDEGLDAVSDRADTAATSNG